MTAVITAALNDQLVGLFYVLVLIAAVVWIITEAFSKSLAKFKDRPIMQVVLHTLPMLLGVAICVMPGTDLNSLLGMFGNKPDVPVTTGVSALIGLLAGSGAIVFHDKIKVFVSRKVEPVLDSESDKPKTASNHTGQTTDIDDQKPSVGG